MASLFAKVSDGTVLAYPYSPEQLRADHPQTSFPAAIPPSVMLEFGIVPVVETPRPAATIFETVVEVQPAFINGDWRQQWAITAAPPPASITRRQCALQLKTLQMITAQEALDMTRSGIPPAAVAAYFATLSDEDRVLAEIDFAAMSYFRDNPLIAALMTANGMTTEQVDQFFIAAAQF